MQTLPEVIVQEKNKLATPSAWFVLLDIVLGDALTLYLCSNTENVTFKGRVYEAFPFNLEPTKQTAKGEIPSVTLKVANVTQIIQGYLEDLDGAVGATVIVRVVNSAYLSEDYSELEMTFGVLGSEADAEWVSFTLGLPNPLKRRFPPPSLHGLALQLDLQGGRMQLCGHSRELRPLLRHLRQGDAELREIRRPPGPQPEGMEDRMTIPAPSGLHLRRPPGQILPIRRTRPRSLRLLRSLHRTAPPGGASHAGRLSFVPGFFRNRFAPPGRRNPFRPGTSRSATLLPRNLSPAPALHVAYRVRFAGFASLRAHHAKDAGYRRAPRRSRVARQDHRLLRGET